jgi:F-type H+-transporting ATPase subunit b
MDVIAASTLSSSYLWWWGAQLVSVAFLIYLFLRWRPGFLGGRTIGETLGAALDARKAQIDEQLKVAERNREEAERLRAQVLQDVETAREEAQKIVAGSSRTAEAIRQEIEQRAAEERQRILAQGRADIRQEEAQAMQALQRRAADIVIDAAGQIVSSHMDEASDQQLISSSLHSMGGQG